MTATRSRPLNLAAGMPAAGGQFLLERRARLVRPFLPRNRDHLVDFGCGNGAQTAFFLDDFSRVSGVDLNPEFLASFQAVIDQRGLQERVTAMATGGGAIPLADGCADCLTSFTVLEHVPDEATVLAEMRRVLRPQGRLIVSVPNRWWVFETHGADLPFLPWNRVPLVSWWPKRLHDRWARARIYRRRELVRMLTAAGFTVTRSFRMTAPLDMISWAPARRLARGTLFKPDRAPLPVLATEIVAVATR